MPCKCSSRLDCLNWLLVIAGISWIWKRAVVTAKLKGPVVRMDTSKTIMPMLKVNIDIFSYLSLILRNYYWTWNPRLLHNTDFEKSGGRFLSYQIIKMLDGHDLGGRQVGQYGVSLAWNWALNHISSGWEGKEGTLDGSHRVLQVLQSVLRIRWNWKAQYTVNSSPIQNTTRDHLQD